MPLACLNNGQLLTSFGLTDDQWVAIKTGYRGGIFPCAAARAPLFLSWQSWHAFFRPQNPCGVSDRSRITGTPAAEVHNRRECHGGRLAGLHGGIGVRS
jgi:hypothetical protein